LFCGHPIRILNVKSRARRIFTSGTVATSKRSSGVPALDRWIRRTRMTVFFALVHVFNASRTISSVGRPSLYVKRAIIILVYWGLDRQGPDQTVPSEDLLEKNNRRRYRGTPHTWLHMHVYPTVDAWLTHTPLPQSSDDSAELQSFFFFVQCKPYQFGAHRHS